MLTGRTLNPTLDRMLTWNRVLDEALASSLQGSDGQAWVPAMDVVERPDAYLIALDVPGVDADTIDISFEQNVLTVRGSRPIWFRGADDTGVRVYAAERASGSFERAMRLPEFVDGDHIAAEHKNGVLFLTVPKARAAQARKIRVTGGDSKRVEA